MLNTILLSTALFTSFSPSSQDQDEVPVTQQGINEAIDRGVKYLLSNQHVDGSWFGGKTNVYPHPEGGATALSVAALLHSGMDSDHQAVVRGAAYARSRPMQMFYGTVTRILMEDILGENRDERQLKSLAEFLVGGAKSDYFDYPGVDKPGDLSITQYAVLGMWMAKRNGVKIPDKVLETTMKIIMRNQLPDGGWAYFGQTSTSPYQSGGEGGGPTCSMTTAGMSSLLFILDALGEKHRVTRKYKEDVEESLEKGHEWLKKHMSYEYNFTPTGDEAHNRQWDLYYYYTIERLGSISGAEQLGGKDWYKTGSSFLVKSQLPNGGWATSRNPEVAQVNGTAFALLFLVRATASITGEGVKRKKRSIASLEPDKAKVDLRINLTKRPVVWIAQFGRDVLDSYGKKGQFGLRVEKVTYYIDGEDIGDVAGNIDINSGSERFAMELDIGPGRHEVRAVVTLAPEPDAGLPVGDRRVEVSSPTLELKVDWTMTEAQRLSLDELSANLIPGTNPTVSVSSEQDASGEGAFAVDGTTGTWWSPDESDSEPSIRLSWKRGIKAKTLVLTPLQGIYTMTRRLASGETEVETYWGLARQLPARIEVSINGKETEYELKGEAREHIDLGKTHTIKSLEIKILGTRPANDRAQAGTGFSEIELLGKVKKRR